MRYDALLRQENKVIAKRTKERKENYREFVILKYNLPYESRLAQKRHNTIG